jgi:hypothetical protein
MARFGRGIHPMRANLEEKAIRVQRREGNGKGSTVQYRHKQAWWDPINGLDHRPSPKAIGARRHSRADRACRSGMSEYTREYIHGDKRAFARGSAGSG